VVSSFLLNYIAQFWNPARRIAFLSILQYHRPLVAMRTGAWPVKDLLILLALALMLWFSAATIFARRDLSTT
jgi:hypothetical protein